MLLAQGRWDEAAEACREAIRLDVDLGRAHVDLWTALEAAQRYPELEAATRAVLERGEKLERRLEADTT